MFAFLPIEIFETMWFEPTRPSKFLKQWEAIKQC